MFVRAALCLSVSCNLILVSYVVFYRSDTKSAAFSRAANEFENSLEKIAHIDRSVLGPNAVKSVEHITPGMRPEEDGHSIESDLHTDQATYQAFGELAQTMARYFPSEYDFHLEDRELQESAKYYQSFLSKESYDDVPLTEKLDSLWKAGRFEEALHMADERLADDSKDLMGWLIRLEYYFVKCQFDKWAGAASVVIEVSKEGKYGPLYEGLKTLCLARIGMTAKQLERLLRENRLPAADNQSGRGALFLQREFFAALEMDSVN